MSTGATLPGPAAQKIFASTGLSVGVEIGGSRTARRACSSVDCVTVKLRMCRRSPPKLNNPTMTATTRIPMATLIFRGIRAPPETAAAGTSRWISRWRWKAVRKFEQRVRAGRGNAGDFNSHGGLRNRTQVAQGNSRGGHGRSGKQLRQLKLQNIGQAVARVHKRELRLLPGNQRIRGRLRRGGSQGGMRRGG